MVFLKCGDGHCESRIMLLRREMSRIIFIFSYAAESLAMEISSFLSNVQGY